MNINNPTTFGTPNLTLSTSNSSGTGGALRSDDTILVFDTSDPASVGVSAGVGSAVTAPRRDHVHAGIGGAGTVVDNAIARFNGTGGTAIQGYSSLAPTISDAGIISLTSGALAFPATAIASTNANTLDDYEQGAWTPDLKFGGNKIGITYGTQIGSYTKIGNFVLGQAAIGLSSKGSSTGTAKLEGLPFATLGNPLPPAVVYVRNVSVADYPLCLIVGSLLQFGNTTNAGTYSGLTNTNFADNSEIWLSFLYEM